MLGVTFETKREEKVVLLESMAASGRSGAPGGQHGTGNTAGCGQAAAHSSTHNLMSARWGIEVSAATPRLGNQWRLWRCPSDSNF